MQNSNSLPILSRLAIPFSEINFRFSRASGAGGQHVNTTSTRVTLVWNIASSNALSDQQKQTLVQKLANRISQDGDFLLHSDRFRSQVRNREDCLARFQESLQRALTPKKKRVATKPTKGSVEKRLQSKRKKADTKKSRGRYRGD